MASPTQAWRVRCAMCTRLVRIERMVRAWWEADDRSSLDAGRVCADCWHDLPDRVDGNGVSWQLVARAP